GGHRARRRSGDPQPVSPRGPHRPACGTRGTGARRRRATARQRHRADAAARHHARRARSAARRGGRGDPRGDRGVSGLLVTGTDTGVGKTFVACALAHALRARGRTVSVMKPVETGVTEAPDDALRLREAAADPAPFDEICPYRFRAPVAPSVAARLEG